MKNRHWLELTEYVSIAGVATGAVASFMAKQALYLSTPLSIALLIGFANRRRVENLQELQTETSVATLKQKLSKQIKALDQHIHTLPTPEMVGEVRNSMLRHSRDELKQLAAKIETVNEAIAQYGVLLNDQNLGGVKDEVQQLQGFYREMYGSLKRMQQTVERVSSQNNNQEMTTQMAQLRAEAEQFQQGLQLLSDQTQPTLSYLQEQVNHLNRQNTTILQQVDANSLKRELDMLMDVVAELVPKRDLNSVMADIRSLQENQENQGQSEIALRKQLQTVLQRLQSVPDVPQFRAQIEETLSWQLRDINQQLRALQNTKQFHSRVKQVLTGELDTINRQLQAQSERPLYKLVFDVNATGWVEGDGQSESIGPSSHPMLGSQRLLEEALSKATQRLILIWPWSSTLQMDRSLMKKLEAFVRSGRRLEVGWCHISASNGQHFLSVINRRWNLDSLAQRSLQLTLKYLLALKRRYPKQVKFRVMGTVENFLVADQTFAALGIEDRLTTITPLRDVSLKLWTADEAVIQQLIQTFDHTELDPEDTESHWNRAVTRYELGDRAGAIADIEQILSVRPNSAMAYNMRGIIRFDQEDTVSALNDFEQALILDSSKGAVYCNRGFLLSEQGDQYRAIADFSLAIQSTSALDDPKALGIAYFYRGLACQKLDDFHGAISDYTNSLDYIPESPVIRYHRGITYQAIAQHAAAIDDLEQATDRFRQQNSQTNTQRAIRHLKKSRVALAEQPQNQDAESSSIRAFSLTSSAHSVPVMMRSNFDADSHDRNAAATGVSMTHAEQTVSMNTESLTTDEVSEVQPVLGSQLVSEISTGEMTSDAIASNTLAMESAQGDAISFAPKPSTVETAAFLPPTAEITSISTDNAAPEPSTLDLSVATPSFLFPGENRSHPTAIQNLDELMELGNGEFESDPADEYATEQNSQTLDLFANLTAEQDSSASLEHETVADMTTADALTTEDELVDGSSVGQIAVMEPGGMEVSTEILSNSRNAELQCDALPVSEEQSSGVDIAPTDVFAAEVPTASGAIAASENKAVTASNSLETSQPSSSNLSSPSLEPSASTRPGPQRRRNKGDLDRLVTTTLTDFFDEVVLANLDAQSLSEFAAEVKSSESLSERPTHNRMIPPNTSDPNSLLGPQQSTLSTQENAKTNPDVDQGIALFEDAQDISKQDATYIAKKKTETSEGDRTTTTQDEPEEIETLVTSTLTDFFETLPDQDMPLDSSAYLLQGDNGTANVPPESQSDSDRYQTEQQDQSPGVSEEHPETLGNFMDAFQDSLSVDEQPGDDAYLDPMDAEKAESPIPTNPPIQFVNEQLLKADPWETDSLFPGSPEGLYRPNNRSKSVQEESLLTDANSNEAPPETAEI